MRVGGSLGLSSPGSTHQCTKTQFQVFIVCVMFTIATCSTAINQLTPLTTGCLVSGLNSVELASADRYIQ